MSNCNRLFPGGQLPGTQPPVSVFVDYDCTGRRRDLTPALYPINTLKSLRIEDNLSAAYVPPNMRLIACQNDFCPPGRTRHVFGPGVYPRFDQYDMNDNISRLVVEESESWPTFLNQCCLGSRDATLCQNYGGPDKPSCRSIMAKHCAQSLDNFRSQPCVRYCQSSPSSCDAIAARLCANSDDPYCACFNAPDYIIRPACFDPKCSSGADVYQTQLHRNQATQCGVYCHQAFDVSDVGRDALLKNIKFINECGQTLKSDIMAHVAKDGTSPPPPPTTPFDRKIAPWMIATGIATLLLIVVGAGYAMSRRSKAKST